LGTRKETVMARAAESGARSRVRITTEGLIPVPAEIQEKWNLKPGDELAFDSPGPDEVRVRRVRRRSILDRLDELKLPSLGRPFTQEDIENAITEAMIEKDRRSRGT
jgi:bifunctional DNA-binding transcriptional regulator/antitoxin component of YhaV-PrlF toxin-antitoxin module